MFSGRSLIYSKNNKGPSTEPWGLQRWQEFLMSFHPPVQLFESAQSERPLSRTEYCLLHHVGEVCAIASYDLLCQTLYWNQVRLGLSVDFERYYGQALQQAEWAGFHKTAFHGNHVGGHTGYHLSHLSWENLFCHMRTTKAQISLRIHTVWSAPLLFAA